MEKNNDLLQNFEKRDKEHLEHLLNATEKDVWSDIYFYAGKLHVKKAQSVNTFIEELELERFCRTVIELGGDLERFSEELLDTLYHFGGLEQEECKEDSYISSPPRTPSPQNALEEDYIHYD